MTIKHNPTSALFVAPFDPQQTLASVESMAQYWSDLAEQYRHVHEQVPDSPDGRRFVLYREWAAESAAEAKRLRESLAD